MNNSSCNMIYGRFVVAALLAVAAVSVGCGAGTPPKRNVAGDISIDGKALNQGTVIFTNQEGEHFYAEIDAKGAFLMPQVAPGLYQASVSVPRFDPRLATSDIDADRGGRPLPVQVPNKYASANTSGLEFSIDEQTETLSIELKK